MSCRDVCKYSSYSCGKLTIPLIVFFTCIPTLLSLYFSQWIRIWVAQSTEERLNPYYRNMFVLILVVFFFFLLLRNIIINSVTLVQTQKLHNDMLRTLLRSKVSFFDSNPVGRILNRFSKDISIGDFVLPFVTNMFMDSGL